MEKEIRIQGLNLGPHGIQFMENLEKTLLPKVYQHVIVALLKNNKGVTAAFNQSIKSLYAEAEKTKQELQKTFANNDALNKKIACRKGCSYCCGLTVNVAAPELHIILEYLLATRTRQEIAELMVHLKAYNRSMKQAVSREERIKITCGFLTNETCSIYSVRPLSCRAWNSTDVRVCIDYLTDPDLEIPVSEAHYTPFDLTRRGIVQAMHTLQLKNTIEELNTGVLRLLEGEFGEPG